MVPLWTAFAGGRMGALCFWWRCIRAAFRHSLGSADAAIMLTSILAGGAADLFGVDIPVNVGSWQFAAGVLGLVVLVRLAIAPYWAWQEVREERDRLKAREMTQEKVDHLSEFLDEGIGTIWNHPVKNAADLNALIAAADDWEKRTAAHLAEHFTRADATDFNRLGVIPNVGRDDAFDDGTGRHAKIIREYALREQRLRSIIDRHTKRDWALNAAR